MASPYNSSLFSPLLSRFSWREVLTFAFFLVFSAGVWFFMALNETYERELAVKVELSGVPDDVVITGEVNDTLRVMVRDKGFAFISYEFGAKLPVFDFDFNSHIRSEGNGSITSSEIHKRLAQELSASTKIVSVKPERLDFKYEQGVMKKVPVRLSGTIEAADHYYIASEQIAPEMVTICAAKKTIDQISCVYVEDMNHVDIVDSLVVTARLKPLQGVKITPPEVRVALYADVMVEQTMEVPISCVGVPDSLVLRTFPAKAELKFNVGASMLRQIQPEHFSVELNFEETSGDLEKCPVHLSVIPSSVRNVRLLTEEVDYLIETR